MGIISFIPITSTYHIFHIYVSFFICLFIYLLIQFPIHLITNFFIQLFIMFVCVDEKELIKRN